jgi:hypothetical protein
MLGIFGLFGRSREMQRFDDALRAAGLHPRIVPEAVKLTTMKQLKEARGGDIQSDGPGFAAAAELLGYCILGPRAFIESNDNERIDAVEARIVSAIEAGQGLDARLILLTLHAKLTHPSVIERYDLALG